MSDMKRAEDIRIRYPFILPVIAEKSYYLFGTTDANTWDGPGIGFDCYRSADLLYWEGPLPAFRPPAGFWATKQFWAPEVHEYNGRFYNVRHLWTSRLDLVSLVGCVNSNCTLRPPANLVSPVCNRNHER